MSHTQNLEPNYLIHRRSTFIPKWLRLCQITPKNFDAFQGYQVLVEIIVMACSKMSEYMT